MIFAVLAIVFVVMPLLELYVFVQIGESIGYLDTIGVLILVSLLGAWLACREGLGVLQRIRSEIDAGRMPTDHLIDGAFVLGGGLLLLLPGFISDAVGLIALFPPTRALLRPLVRKRMHVVTIRRYDGRYDDGRYDDGPGSPPVIDV